MVMEETIRAPFQEPDRNTIRWEEGWVGKTGLDALRLCSVDEEPGSEPQESLPPGGPSPDHSGLPSNHQARGFLSAAPPGPSVRPLLTITQWSH